ncbi:hypothetical protein [Ruegeria arenilitoris]|uniref:hypothetical protein n=1 Tax=Ruegeria arenilitoris TaxID=1173585 RepID=UPI00147CAF91|nr:hypothetical protein [Ruegeria arenilitoris]
MSYKDEFTVKPAISAGPMPFVPARIVAFAVLLFVIVFLTAISIWPHQASTLNQEGGLIETASAAALLAAGFAALWRYPGLGRLYIGLVCLLLAERELEADIYAHDSLAFWALSGLDNLLDLTIIRLALAVIVIGGLFWHGLPNAWRAFKQKAPFLIIFVLAGSAAVVAQLIEEMSGMLSAGLSETMLVRLFVLEETLEMFFSIGILAAVLIGWPKTEIDETSYDIAPEPQSD